MRTKKTAKRKKSKRKNPPKADPPRAGKSGRITSQRKKALKRKAKKSPLRLIVKYHTFLTIFLILFYIVAGSIFDPAYLAKDLEKKYAWAATTSNVLLQLHIAGPPEKTVVSPYSLCNGAAAYVRLEWTATNDTTSYDIYRDGNPLITGVTDMFYNDSVVTVGTNYKYYVVANGPLGSSQSDEVEITVQECYVPPPPPPPPSNLSCTIRTLGAIDLLNYRCLPITNKTRPSITGTASLANARVNAEIRSAGNMRSVLSTFYANGNGYWSWGVQGKSKKGVKYLYVTVVDPADPSRFGSCSLRFKIASKMPNKKTIRKCTKSNVQTQSIAGFFVPSSPLSLDVQNENKVAYSGENLKLKVGGGNELNTAGTLEYQLQDENNNEVLASSESTSGKTDSFEKFLDIPPALQSGKYKVVVGYEENGVQKSTASSFEIKERPFLQLGANLSFTYSEIVSNLGWATFISLLLLLVFGTLLFFEYHLAGRAAVQITGADLKRDGFID